MIEAGQSRRSSRFRDAARPASHSPIRRGTRVPGSGSSRSHMATSGQSAKRQRTGGKRSAAQPRRRQHQDETGIIPVLARTVRTIENSAERGKVSPSNRTRFRVVAVLVREERARIKADAGLTDAERTKELTRLDGIATIMA